LHSSNKTHKETRGKRDFSSLADPGSGTFLTPGSGIRDGRKSASGSGIRDEQPGYPDHIFWSLETILLLFLGIKYLNSLMRIRDPGWNKVGSRIRDKHP
jgi:hypothetical protein